MTRMLAAAILVKPLRIRASKLLSDPDAGTKSAFIKIT